MQNHKRSSQYDNLVLTNDWTSVIIKETYEGRWQQHGTDCNTTQRASNSTGVDDDDIWWDQWTEGSTVRKNIQRAQDAAPCRLIEYTACWQEKRKGPDNPVQFTEDVLSLEMGSRLSNEWELSRLRDHFEYGTVQAGLLPRLIRIILFLPNSCSVKSLDI